MCFDLSQFVVADRFHVLCSAFSTPRRNRINVGASPAAGRFSATTTPSSRSGFAPSSSAIGTPLTRGTEFGFDAPGSPIPAAFSIPSTPSFSQSAFGTPSSSAGVSPYYTPSFPFTDDSEFAFGIPRAFPASPLDRDSSTSLNANSPEFDAAFHSSALSEFGSPASESTQSGATAFPLQPTSSQQRPGNVSEAPVGPRGGFPLMYVCDMAAAFDEIARLERQGTKREVAFGLVLPKPDFDWKPSTFSDQKRAWEAAELSRGEQELWISYGRSAAGKWARFMKKWRKN